MILPLIMRTTEEALKSVPDSFREASFGLGAGRLRTVFKVVLPSAVPGILAGVILAIGRIVGRDGGAHLYGGHRRADPGGKDALFLSGRTLAIHMYVLSSEGLHTNEGIRDGCRAAGHGAAHQHPLGGGRQAAYERLGNRMKDKFQIEGLDLFYGDFQALKNVELSLGERAITAFIGPVGCGKSTLLKSSTG